MTASAYQEEGFKLGKIVNEMADGDTFRGCEVTTTQTLSVESSTFHQLLEDSKSPFLFNDYYQK